MIILASLRSSSDSSGVPVLWTIGVILVVVGLALALIGAMGHAVGDVGTTTEPATEPPVGEVRREGRRAERYRLPRHPIPPHRLPRHQIPRHQSAGSGPVHIGPVLCCPRSGEISGRALIRPENAWTMPGKPASRWEVRDDRARPSPPPKLFGSSSSMRTIRSGSFCSSRSICRSVVSTHRPRFGRVISSRPAMHKAYGLRGCRCGAGSFRAPRSSRKITPTRSPGWIPRRGAHSRSWSPLPTLPRRWRSCGWRRIARRRASPRGWCDEPASGATEDVDIATFPLQR